MKKLFILAAAMVISTAAFAQVGILGGLTSSSTSLSVAYKELSTKMINQYHVGVTYKFSLGKIVAIQPAFIYNVKGATINEVTGIGDINFKTGYLELPVQVQVGATLGKVLRVYGLAEPFIGYAITNSVKTSEDWTKNTWENIKTRFEYGIGLGGGVELFRHLQVNLKYFWNFGPIYGNENTSIGQVVSNSKCGGISLSAVVLF